MFPCRRSKDPITWTQYPEVVLSGRGERLLPGFGPSGTLSSVSLLIRLQTLPAEMVWALAVWNPSNSAP